MPHPHHVGLDVSVKETTISVADALGHVAHRAVVASEPAILVEHLLRLGFTFTGGSAWKPGRFQLGSMPGW